MSNGELTREDLLVDPGQGPELVDKETLWQEGAADVDFGDQELVTLTLGVEEKVWYPAEATIPRSDWEQALALFPECNMPEDLPLGVVLNLIERAGARIIVNEKRGDVQGQTPVGPVSQES